MCAPKSIYPDLVRRKVKSLQSLMSIERRKYRLPFHDPVAIEAKISAWQAQIDKLREGHEKPVLQDRNTVDWVAKAARYQERIDELVLKREECLKNVNS